MSRTLGRIRQHSLRTKACHLGRNTYLSRTKVQFSVARRESLMAKLAKWKTIKSVANRWDRKVPNGYLWWKNEHRGKICKHAVDICDEFSQRWRKEQFSVAAWESFMEKNKEIKGVANRWDGIVRNELLLWTSTGMQFANMCWRFATGSPCWRKKKATGCNWSKSNKCNP